MKYTKEEYGWYHTATNRCDDPQIKYMSDAEYDPDFTCGPFDSWEVAYVDMVQGIVKEMDFLQHVLHQVKRLKK